MSKLLRFVWRTAIVFSPGHLVHVHSIVAFTVVPTNMGKYHVPVKHITVSILHCCFSVLDSVVVFVHWYMIDSPCLACFFVSICTKFRVLSRPSDFTYSMPPP